MSKIVIALGGNALGNTAEEQLKLIEKTSVPIVDLIEEGNQVVVAHGNGPQVGMINNAMSYAANHGEIKGSVPFPECGAMSQGYIGYHLQNGIKNELLRRGLDKSVATIVTQVVVDGNDPAFQHPTKPVGAFYNKEEAERIAAEKGYTMVEDAGRGYRQVVPSPIPVDIVEKDVINSAVNAGFIVVAVGGGGVPVTFTDNQYHGVPAVIDKDFASAKLSELIKADILIILTAVDRVCINFNKPDQREVPEMTIEEAKKYMEEGQFAAGSMLPKVKAAISFAEKGGSVIIASLDKASQALKGESGTRITL